MNAPPTDSDRPVWNISLVQTYLETARSVLDVNMVSPRAALDQESSPVHPALPNVFLGIGSIAHLYSYMAVEAYVNCLLYDTWRSLPSMLDFSCWSTGQVAVYGHHLLSKFVTFVHTDRDAMESVHSFLTSSGYDAWLNPRGSEAKRFAVRENTVVVRPRVTTQPAVDHRVPIEGLLVDLFVESQNLSLVDTSEFFSLFQNALGRGRISMALLQEYAGKRKSAALELSESIIREYP